MESKPPLLKGNSSLKQVLQTASESDSLFYPVVDEESSLIGIISFLKIKNLFFMEGLENLVVAYDLMTDVLDVAVPEDRLTGALKKMKAIEMEVLPVVRNNQDHHLVGMIEQRRIQQVLGKEIIRRNCEGT